MAITPSYTTRSGCKVVHGSYTGDGASTVSLVLGQVPLYGRVWNYTDGDAIWEYHSGMAAGYALSHNIVATAEHSVVTSNGFTAIGGVSATSSKGITLGTAMTENAKVFHFYFVLG